jgi:dephospho-CoA kinase
MKKCGAEIVDADKIARQVVQKGMSALKEIENEFGKDVLTPGGELDRKKLADIVFSDEKKLKVLNSITHKHILDEMKLRVKNSDSEVVVLDVPLLFQCDFPIKCDLTIAVIADKETRLQRIMERDGVKRSDAESRMSKQLTDKEYSDLADVCFENDGDIEKVREFARKIILD